MAEYIDRMKVRIAIIDTKWICDQDEDVAYDMIDSIPAADVEEVKHGHWIEQSAPRWKTWYCSECKTLGSPHWKRCPVCEAKMDGGKENEIE